MIRRHRCDPIQLSSSRLQLVLPLLVLLGLGTQSTHASSEQQCDEFKCRSPGYFLGYVCWALIGTDPTPSANPPMCDGGYVAVPMEMVPLLELPELGGTFYYYTCCPPTSNISIIPATIPPFCAPYFDGYCGDFSADCSADGPMEPMTCIDEYYKYPHKTGFTALNLSWRYSQYRCCSAPPESIHCNACMWEMFRAVFGTIGFFFTFTIVVGVLMSKIARQQTFNMYVVFALLGEFVSSLNGIVVGATGYSQSNTKIPCELSATTFIFSIFSSLWIGAVTIREVFIMLLRSKQVLRTSPPTIRKVLIQVFLVYLLSGGFSWWYGFMMCPSDAAFSFASKIASSTEDAKLEKVQSNSIAVTTIFVFIPPIVYIVYVSIRVWKEQLLPNTGRTRLLFVYFLRIAVTAIMQLPLFVIILCQPYNLIIGAHYIALVGLTVLNWISFYLVLTKPDVRLAWKMLLTCRCFSKDASNARGSLFFERSLMRLNMSSSKFFSSRLFVRGPHCGSTEFGSQGDLERQHNKSKPLDLVDMQEEGKKEQELLEKSDMFLFTERDSVDKPDASPSLEASSEFR
mmetsp:Transcript_13519/g.18901  ORF Transcript_13519/g.18901 Transcript_13519/m.18901 type:complete len:570 (+) Transcript_13519:146-1855(+)